MNKKWSLSLGSFSGIKVFIHWTFFILIGWIFLMHFRMGHGFSEGLSGVLFILVLFACVVLHEFGHALTAKRFGVSTRDITIYPIGGIASLESMPSRPVQELQVALAGPAVNVIIAGLLWIYLKSTGQIPDFGVINISMTGTSFLFNLLYVNIVLAVFNLIPAFPMDGGRVLRSLLAMKMDQQKATNIAAKIGQFLAIIFVFFGFFYDFWLVFIGMFIFLGAGAESKAEEIKHSLEGIRVKDVLMTKFTMLNLEYTLQIAASHLLNSNEKSFLVTENNKIVGILDYKAIVTGLHDGKMDAGIGGFMQKDFHWLRNEDKITDILPLMQIGDQSLFPVKNDDDNLAGVISAENISKWIQTRPYIFNH